MTEESIPLVPPTANMEKVEAALKRREEADYQSYLILQGLMDHYRWVLDEQALSEDDRRLRDLLERADEVLEERIKANDEAMRALSGR